MSLARVWDKAFWTDLQTYDLTDRRTYRQTNLWTDEYTLLKSYKKQIRTWILWEKVLNEVLLLQALNTDCMWRDIVMFTWFCCFSEITKKKNELPVDEFDLSFLTKIICSNMAYLHESWDCSAHLSMKAIKLLDHNWEIFQKFNSSSALILW